MGVDFAGSLRYQKGKKNEDKAYIVFYACSLTCVIYLGLLPRPKNFDQLKRLVERHRHQSMFYLDNGKIFSGAEKLLKTIMADKKLQYQH